MPYRRAPKPGDPDYKHIPKPVVYGVRAAAVVAVAIVIFEAVQRFG